MEWEPKSQQLRVLVPAGSPFAVGDSITISNARSGAKALTPLEGQTGIVRSAAQGLLCPRGTSGFIVSLAFAAPPYKRQWCNTRATATLSFK